MVEDSNRESKATVSAVLLAAGKGERIGGISKALLPLPDGCSLLQSDINRLRNIADEIVAGIAPDLPLPEGLQNYPGFKRTKGGSTRLETLNNALEATTGAIVLVWDVARPWVSLETVHELIGAAVEHGAAMPVLRFRTRESLGIGKNGFLEASFPREGLFLSQTPQAYRKDILRDSLEKARATGNTDFSVHSLVKNAGYPVRLIDGATENVKLTFPEDLDAFLSWNSRQK